MMTIKLNAPWIGSAGYELIAFIAIPYNTLRKLPRVAYHLRQYAKRQAW